MTKVSDVIRKQGSSTTHRPLLAGCKAREDAVNSVQVAYATTKRLAPATYSFLVTPMSNTGCCASKSHTRTSSCVFGRLCSCISDFLNQYTYDLNKSMVSIGLHYMTITITKSIMEGKGSIVVDHGGRGRSADVVRSRVISPQDPC